MSVPAHLLEAEGERARRSPYQGLVPYSEEDTDWFFGRDDWREIIVDNLRAYRLSVLYGASGVGKSSVLNAGVVHRLREEARRNLAESGAPGLVVVSFASWSTADPVDALKEAVRESVEQVAPGLTRDAPTGPLADVLSAWGKRIEGSLFVVLDQFEEYFVYHPRDQGLSSFSEELSLALRRRDTPGNFLISIREDALAQLDRFEGRVPGLLDHLLRIEHLGREGAREAIERPLDRWNQLNAGSGEEVEIEPELIEAVLAQVAAGKVVVGESDRAVLDAGNSEQRIEAPYLQLVLSHLWAEEERVGSRLLRLVTLQRLGGADRIVRTHLDATMDDFPRREQDIAARALRYLVTPSGTKIALRRQDLAEFAEAPNDRLGPVLAVLAGEARILRPVRNETYEIYHDALAGPILDWSARWQERQRRRRERRRVGLFASAATVLTIVAGAFVVLMLQAQHARDVARSRELATTATAQLENDPQESLLLAMQAVTAASTEQAEDVLRIALAEANIRAVLHGHTDSVATAAFSSDGRFIVTAGNDGTARIWDTESGRSLHVLRGHAGRVLGAAFSSDGKLVVSAGADGTARIWEAQSGASLRILYGHGDRVFSAVFSPDGRRIVTASADETARVWSSASGRLLRVLRGHAAFVRSAAFSPDGKLIVTAGDDGIGRVWDAESGTRLRILRGHGGAVYSAAFSPDGRRIVTASADRTARIWDTESGRSLRVLRGHAGAVDSAAFSPDGKLVVVTSSADGTARVWDAESGRKRHLLSGHRGAVDSAAFSPDGTLVVTSSADGTARVWDAESGTSVHVLRGHAGFGTAAFSANGRLIVTAGDDGIGRIWDAESGTRLRILRGHGGAVYSAAFSPDGRLIVTAGADGTARVWDAESGKRLHVLRGHGGAVYSAAFSPDGRRIVTAGADRTGRVWDAESGKRLHVLRGHGDVVYSAAFSPDGRRIVTAGADGTARVWDTKSGTSLVVLHGHGGAVYSAAFSPDGKLIATAGADRTARVWDSRTGVRLTILYGHRSWVYSATFSPDGKLIATTSFDGTTRIYRCEVCGSMRELRDRAREQLAHS